MKRLLALPIYLLLAVLPLAAQHPWSVLSVEELGISDVYLLPYSQGLSDTLARDLDRPLPAGICYHVSGPHSRLGRSYMLFAPLPDTTGAVGDAVRVPLKHVPALLPSVVSCSYWQQRFLQFLHWSYVDMNAASGILAFDTIGHRYGRYSPLHLLGYHYQADPLSPVLFTLSTNKATPQHAPVELLQRLAEAGAFATEADVAAEERQLHQARKRDLRSRDSVSAILDSLDSRSVLIARQADSIALELEADSIAQERQQQRAEVEKTKNRMNRDKIFIINVKPARSEYMFGIELNLYNCFPRTIASIELTVAPYNERGQLQQDKFRRTNRTMRCMGPVPPSSPAQYTFDELFWDDRGRIKYMRLTAITFTFTDGSRRSFSGYNQIQKHTLNN